MHYLGSMVDQSKVCWDGYVWGVLVFEEGLLLEGILHFKLCWIFAKEILSIVEHCYLTSVLSKCEHEED